MVPAVSNVFGLAHVRGVGVGVGHASLFRTLEVGALIECFVGVKLKVPFILLLLFETIPLSQLDGPRTDEILHQGSTDEISCEILLLWQASLAWNPGPGQMFRG